MKEKKFKQYMETYYPNIAKVRAEKYTQAEFANEVGIKQQEISRYESGETKAPISYIVDLAKCCNESIDYITGISEKKNKQDEIIELYNKLSYESQIKIIERATVLLEMETEESNKKEKIS